MRWIWSVFRSLALLATAGFALGGTIDFLPSNQIQHLGTSFTVAVQIVNPGPNGVGDYDLTIAFNAGVISASAVNFGTFLGGPANSFQSSSIGLGSAEITEVSLLSPDNLIALQPSSFTLATITFNVLGYGTTPLNFSAITIDDANALPLTVVSIPGSVSVVPEPSSFLGVASAFLIGFVGLLRWRFAETRRG